MAMNGYGWTGVTLRVNLTTRMITKENTMTEWIGGPAYGYKVLWDEVPASVGCFDPENKLIINSGPVTGTSAPCSGRSTITTIFPPAYNPELPNLPGTGHFGGHFGAEQKFAGYDNIIIEGAASAPVWLKIVDDAVSIEDATSLWGKGIHESNELIIKLIGDKRAQSLSIGPAGENLVRFANAIHAIGHSAGGVGGVFGSKKLKGIGIMGSKPVKIAADPADWRDLIQFSLDIIGSNNQNILPTNMQGWNEYYYSGSRWYAKEGLYWGAADIPVETGICPPGDNNRIGYRCMKAGDISSDVQKKQDLTVRMSGCHSCPIRCNTSVYMPGMKEKYGISNYGRNTCLGWSRMGSWLGGTLTEEMKFVGRWQHDDLGLFCGYHMIQAVFHTVLERGYLQNYLSDEEWNDIPWDLYEANDPEWIRDITTRMAYKIGELGDMLAGGPGYMCHKLGVWDEFITDDAYGNYSAISSHIGHHTGRLAGDLINIGYNRDPMNHGQVIARWGGLPQAIRENIFMDQYGSADGLELESTAPVTLERVKFAVWCQQRKELTDSLAVCNWMFSFIQSPLKERGYKGDSALESKYLSLVTGENWTEEAFDAFGLKAFLLHRALTQRALNTIDMRHTQDAFPPCCDGDAQNTDGVTYAAEWETILDYYYQELGCDADGNFTRAGLEAYGLGFVADEFQTLGLLA